MEAVQALLPFLMESQQPSPVHPQGAAAPFGTMPYFFVPANCYFSMGDVTSSGGLQSTLLPDSMFTLAVPERRFTNYPSAHLTNGVDGAYVGKPCDEELPSCCGKDRKARRMPNFLKDFLLPHLNNGMFGERLKWVDRAGGIFQVSWTRKTEYKWTTGDFVVFLEWDKMKNHPVDQSPQYWCTVKQRFRSALEGVSCEWLPPAGEPLPGVKLRKIIWKEGVQRELWGAPTCLVRTGAVRRRTSRRTRRFRFPEHDSDTEDEEEDSYCEGGRAVCHRCGYSTGDLRLLVRHRMLHRNLRTFCCRYCPRRFCLPEGLLSHMQVHPEGRPYTCPRCGLHTRLLLQLRRHEVRSIAQSLNLCHRCGLICQTPDDLREHLLKVHKVILDASFCTAPFQICPGTSAPGGKADTQLPQDYTRRPSALPGENANSEEEPGWAIEESI